MHGWLKRVGYRPFVAGVGRNADCPELLTERLLVAARLAQIETGRAVALVGHSLGGMLARTAAAREPAIIQQVITMGSPFRSLGVHPFLLGAANLVRSGVVYNRRRQDQVPDCCYTPECTCDFARSLQRGPAAAYRRDAIYSRLDGVVDWRACVE